VVLLDEIEKAHPDTFNILLQVLDDGRLTDNKGRIANFKNTIIIMTSNAGAMIIQEHFDGFDKKDVFEQLDIIDRTKEEVFALLRKTIRPEFLNRIDDIVMFKPLLPNVIQQIVDIQWKQIQHRLLEGGVVVEADDIVIAYLAKEGYDPQYGARPLKRLIQNKILNALSKEILAGKVKKDSHILVTLDSEHNILFKNLEKLEVAKI
jgi:ATP-dependent Clp protease ATP-binding subunit ClpB